VTDEKRDLQNSERYGLGTEPRDQWPRVSPAVETKPIDLLAPGSEKHQKVRDYLLARLKTSERKMAQFKDRWRVNEKKVQAYINLKDHEKTLKELNKSGEPAMAVQVAIPYSYAVIQTISTFLLHLFTGRKPLFQIGADKDESVEPARKMEIVLQYQAGHTRLVRQFNTFLNATQIYGMAAFKSQWERDVALRSNRRLIDITDDFGNPTGQQNEITERVPKLVYEGNRVESVDPFMFFPDPRVPLTEVNRRGEYVFCRAYEGRHILKRIEAEGKLKWVDHANRALPRNVGDGGESDRSLVAEGDAHPGLGTTDTDMQQNFMQVDQCSIIIIPRELGLGESDLPEMWLFTILNKDQIVQADRLDDDHGMHNVAVAEPLEMGHGFGNLGMADYLDPVADTISWLVNSRIQNTRKSLNDMFVVDPSMVEMQDMKRPGPGKLIRLKRAAYGQDVRGAVQQLNVLDVTARHIADVEQFVRLGQFLTAVDDNVQGIQDRGSRKTATEVRTALERAASRLAAQGVIISSQAVVDLTEQMSLNTQQRLSNQFYLDIVGAEGIQTRITPGNLVGDFNYPIHDGTLPLDKVALLDVWKEIFTAVLADPGIRQAYDVTKMFEYIAELGGARNIQAMRVQTQPMSQGTIDSQVQQGNMLPLPGGNGAASGPSGMINALSEDPSQRVAGGLL
jgi:hypothetical protein